MTTWLLQAAVRKAGYTCIKLIGSSWGLHERFLQAQPQLEAAKAAADGLSLYQAFIYASVAEGHRVSNSAPLMAVLISSYSLCFP